VAAFEQLPSAHLPFRTAGACFSKGVHTLVVEKRLAVKGVGAARPVGTSAMVMRTAKKGANAGSKYPGCKEHAWPHDLWRFVPWNVGEHHVSTTRDAVGVTSCDTAQSACLAPSSARLERASGHHAAALRNQ
jgi:hypothetical protein